MPIEQSCNKLFSLENTESILATTYNKVQGNFVNDVFFANLFISIHLLRG